MDKEWATGSFGLSSMTFQVYSLATVKVSNACWCLLLCNTQPKHGLAARKMVDSMIVDGLWHLGSIWSRVGRPGENTNKGSSAMKVCIQPVPHGHHRRECGSQIWCRQPLVKASAEAVNPSKQALVAHLLAKDPHRTPLQRHPNKKLQTPRRRAAGPCTHLLLSSRIARDGGIAGSICAVTLI